MSKRSQGRSIRIPMPIKSTNTRRIQQLKRWKIWGYVTKSLLVGCKDAVLQVLMSVCPSICLQGSQSSQCSPRNSRSLHEVWWVWKFNKVSYIFVWVAYKNFAVLVYFKFLRSLRCWYDENICFLDIELLWKVYFCLGMENQIWKVQATDGSRKVCGLPPEEC